jgi:methyltransferase-like protein
MLKEPKATPYDIVAYPSYIHSQTHPDRLAVIGTLLGMEPCPVDRCRVLELGCGTGSNLVPMASLLPQSQFLGLDLAAQAVAKGQQMIREVGLPNVRLVQANLAEFQTGTDKFDYIIAHGVFSWVPPYARERMLALCRNSLAPQGIAFISYNAFPGAHLRNMIREMMLYHVRAYESPSDRIGQALSFVKFLADAQDGQTENRFWFKSELQSVLDHDSDYIFHDELADVNQPFYFTQFMEKAVSHGLQYLGEANYHDMFSYGFNESTRETLKRLDSNRILKEQYLDFLKCRRFRQTLLCHREATLTTSPLAEKVADFYISSPARPVQQTDLRSDSVIEYRTSKGAKCATDYSLGKAALAALSADEWVRFDDLKSRAERMLLDAGLTPETDLESTDKFSRFLLDLYSAGVVEFRTHLPTFTRTVSERPAVSALTRWQVENSEFVTTPLHMAVQIEDEVGRCLLSSLDGTLDRAALQQKLWQLLISKNALAIVDVNESAVREKVGRDLDESLARLAKLGLLAS